MTKSWLADNREQKALAKYLTRSGDGELALELTAAKTSGPGDPGQKLAQITLLLLSERVENAVCFAIRHRPGMREPWRQGPHLRVGEQGAQRAFGGLYTIKIDSAWTRNPVKYDELLKKWYEKMGMLSSGPQ